MSLNRGPQNLSTPIELIFPIFESLLMEKVKLLARNAGSYAIKITTTAANT